MKRAEHSLAAILPNTDYYEIDSRLANARYGVWVCCPAGATQGSRSFPAVFMPDGNSSAAMLMPMSAFVNSDPINPVQAVIQPAFCGPVTALRHERDPRHAGLRF
jgi:uncharacterized protein